MSAVSILGATLYYIIYTAYQMYPAGVRDSQALACSPEADTIVEPRRGRFQAIRPRRAPFVVGRRMLRIPLHPMQNGHSAKLPSYLDKQLHLTQRW